MTSAPRTRKPKRSKPINHAPFMPVGKFRFIAADYPPDERDVEAIRDSGRVLVAQWRGGLWWSEGRTIDTIADRIAMWRPIA